MTVSDQQQNGRTLVWTLLGLYAGGVAVTPLYAPLRRASVSFDFLFGLWAVTAVVGATAATAGKRRLATAVDRLTRTDESGWDLLVVCLLGYLLATVVAGAGVSLFTGVVGPGVTTAVSSLLATGLAGAGVVARGRGQIDYPEWAESGGDVMLFGVVFLYTYLQLGALLGAASGLVAIPLGVVCGVGAVGLRRLDGRAGDAN
jgi:hypothetical protein